jgi:hypothetical protein
MFFLVHFAGVSTFVVLTVFAGQGNEEIGRRYYEKLADFSFLFDDAVAAYSTVFVQLVILLWRSLLV